MATATERPHPKTPREETSSTAGPGPTAVGENLNVREETAPCPNNCGAEVAYTRIQIGGRWTQPPVPICDECQEEEDQRKAREHQERASQAQAAERDRRQQALPRLLAEAGASPWEHGHCTLENFDQEESGPEPLEAAREFLGAVREAGTYDPVRGLYLAGETGTGKTHLAVAVLRELLLDPSVEPGTLVYDPVDVFVSRVRSLYGGKGDVDAFLSKRQRARVWLLDDLGREAPHPDVVGHLTMLVAQRAMRPTLITGNYRPEEYERRHAELGRMGSRLGPAYFRTVYVEGRDRRFDE